MPLLAAAGDLPLALVAAGDLILLLTFLRTLEYLDKTFTDCFFGDGRLIFGSDVAGSAVSTRVFSAKEVSSWPFEETASFSGMASRVAEALASLFFLVRADT